jgi:ATP-binding cassette subfamily C (CFTR/MRP) protein 1
MNSSNEWSKNAYEKEVPGLPPALADDIEGAGAAKKDSAWRKKRQLNPLRWQKVPPVPENSSVSREAAAGFFSKLTLSWIGPLMKV